MASNSSSTFIDYGKAFTVGGVSFYCVWHRIILS